MCGCVLRVYTREDEKMYAGEYGVRGGNFETIRNRDIYKVFVSVCFVSVGQVQLAKL
jgi:hypothetical protein